MKKRVLLVLFSVLLLTLLWPSAVLADDDDFEVEYEFSPEIVGYNGGTVQLLLTVRNTGPTNITWVDVVINLKTPFSSRWTGTIAPGASRAVSVTIPFSYQDLDVQRILQVSMNNNSTANPDGLKMMPFTLTSTRDMYSITASISPSRAEYAPGDTVTISYTITNLMETHTLMHMKTRAVMDNERFELLYTGTNVDLGNVFPGESKTSSFRITFGEEYTGEIRLSSTQQFAFLDTNYTESKPLLTFTVASPEPEVSFTAALHADETEVDAGDTVTLRIALGNTGSDAIGMFEVYTEGGALEATLESLPAGGSGSVTLTETIYETTTFRYVVTGTTGETAVSQETNAVTVTVRESETSESASTGEAETLAPPDASAEASQAEPATVSETPVAATAASETAQPASASPGLLDMPYLLIWILALLVLIAIAVIIMLMIKKKKKA